jgi:NAD(P)-dependent dehydrogenase (short-subunit alcohol dehydrogenase family)
MAAVYPDLSGRRVFVTGGASGIGADMVRAFLGQGAKVAFADIQDEAGQSLVRSLQPCGDILFISCDLRDTGQLRHAVGTASEWMGGIDVLVNNAARDDRHRFEDVTPEIWDESQAVNLRHQFFASQAAAPLMAGRGGGSIICLGSVSWMMAMPGMAGYTAAKGAINALTRTLARELGDKNIRVNCVVPGAVLTERQQQLWLTAEREQRLVAMQALRLRLVGSDIANMVLFLASEQARGCTGQNFVVDAGITLN